MRLGSVSFKRWSNLGLWRMKQQYYVCIVCETPTSHARAYVLMRLRCTLFLGRIPAMEEILLIRKRQLLHRSMQDKTMHATNSWASILILCLVWEGHLLLSWFTMSSAAVSSWTGCPCVERAPKMQAVSDLSNEDSGCSVVISSSGSTVGHVSCLHVVRLVSILIFEWLINGSIVQHEPAALKQSIARLWGCFSALLTGN